MADHLDPPALRTMDTAPRDRTPVIVKFRDDLNTIREDLGCWNGLFAVMRYQDDLLLWGYHGPLGQGGFPDEWMVGWAALPECSASVPEKPDNCQTADTRRWKILNQDDYVPEIAYFVTTPITLAQAQRLGTVLGEAEVSPASGAAVEKDDLDELSRFADECRPVVQAAEKLYREMRLDHPSLPLRAFCVGLIVPGIRIGMRHLPAASVSAFLTTFANAIDAGALNPLKDRDQPGDQLQGRRHG